jgi:hypothetical protein
MTWDQDWIQAREILGSLVRRVVYGDDHNFGKMPGCPENKVDVAVHNAIDQELVDAITTYEHVLDDRMRKACEAIGLTE